VRRCQKEIGARDNGHHIFRILERPGTLQQVATLEQRWGSRNGKGILVLLLRDSGAIDIDYLVRGLL
jgi:hypothetical protein